VELADGDIISLFLRLSTHSMRDRYYCRRHCHRKSCLFILGIVLSIITYWILHLLLQGHESSLTTPWPPRLMVIIRLVEVEWASMPWTKWCLYMPEMWR